ncbi:MAG: dihydrodipicolinate synthase family protein [Saprospiraceae bacterium]|nr:dihydrodipicolinate synthase family protein [Saprospiraceae bacterium]
MKRFERLEGLIAAPFTPMHEYGSLNLDIIPDYYKLLKRNKVIGAFINGSTGEGVSQTGEEKKQVIQAWSEATKGDSEFKVINLVGGTSLAESVEMASFSEEMGLFGIAYTSPYYFKPATARVLADCCTQVAAAAPNIAFYYYHIPVLTGCNVTMLDLLNTVNGSIPNFAGIKYTHEDFMDFLSCIYQEGGRYDMLWGRDENMLSALALGSFGAVGSTFNYAAPLYLDMIEAFKRGELLKARDLQKRSIDIIRLLGKYGGITVGKAYMKLIGLDCGKFRLPLQNMSPEQYESFSKDVAAIGFDELRSV